MAGIPGCEYTEVAFEMSPQLFLTILFFTVLEERANYRKESANGLYSALPFVIANSVVTLPFLFLCSTLFVLIMYWGIVSLVNLCQFPSLAKQTFSSFTGTPPRRWPSVPVHRVLVSVNLRRRKSSNPGRVLSANLRGCACRVRVLEWILDERWGLLVSSVCQTSIKLYKAIY